MLKFIKQETKDIIEAAMCFVGIVAFTGGSVALCTLPLWMR